MTGIAIAFLLLALVLVWGGFIASMLLLRARPELVTYPPGGQDDDHRDEGAPDIRDT
ncbi:MAG TPA: MetS family NSS transporter small subunit [Microbacterium sp.]|nr:MetS family NSS transporter small subunit [Microbacterium sp.]